MCFFNYLGTMVVVRLDDQPQLCKTDEVGELCLSATYCGIGYWGLAGVSNSTFKVRRCLSDSEIQLHLFSVYCRLKYLLKNAIY